MVVYKPSSTGEARLPNHSLVNMLVHMIPLQRLVLKIVTVALEETSNNSISKFEDNFGDGMIKGTIGMELNTCLEIPVALVVARLLLKS